MQPERIGSKSVAETLLRGFCLQKQEQVALFVCAKMSKNDSVRHVGGSTRVRYQTSFNTKQTFHSVTEKEQVKRDQHARTMG